MTILCNDLTLEQINAALLRIQRSIQTGNNNFQNDVEKAVANVTITGKTTIQKYDDSRLMAIVNELNQKYNNLSDEQASIRNKIVSLETILANVALDYDPETNELTYSLGDYSNSVTLRDTTYTFSYDDETGAFTIVDDFTGETVFSETFNDTTYTFSFDNGILTVHNNLLDTDQTFNFDARYYTESEIQSLILDKIPSEASSSNQLADKAFVNSSISTATATFRGTVTTTQALEALTGDLNDYAYLQNIDPTTGLTTSYDRYKWVESGGDYGHWKYEYTLNNSSFTADQWAAINSGITCQIVTDLLAGCYSGDGSALCKSAGNEWRSLLATNCDCTGSVKADYIYYNTNVQVNQCNGALSATCYCVYDKGWVPFTKYGIKASDIGLVAKCCYTMTCFIEQLRCCYGKKPGAYKFTYANACSAFIKETGGYDYSATFIKLDAIDANACWQRENWKVINTDGKEWSITAVSADALNTYTWLVCPVQKYHYAIGEKSNSDVGVLLSWACPNDWGATRISCGCPLTFNTCTGTLKSDNFYGKNQYHCILPNPYNTLTYATIELDNDGWNGETLVLDVAVYNSTFHAQFIELGCKDTSAPSTIDISRAWSDTCDQYGVKCFGRSTVAGNTCVVYLSYTNYRPVYITSNKRIKSITRSTTAPENVRWVAPSKGSPLAGAFCRCAVTNDANCYLALTGGCEDGMPTSFQVSCGCPITYNPGTGLLSVCGTCIGFNRTKSICARVTPPSDQSSCWIYVGRFQTNGTGDTTNTYNELNLTIAAVGTGMVSSANIKVSSANATAPTVIVQRQCGYTTSGIDCVAVTRSGSVWNCYTCVWARVKPYGTCVYFVHLYRNMLPDTWTTALTVCSAITGDIVGVGNADVNSRTIQSNASLRIGCLVACTSSIAGCAGTNYGTGWMEMYTTTPFIDFHVNNYCGDYSSRIIANTGSLGFNVNNATGCTASTESAGYTMCSNGILYSQRGFVAGCVNAACPFISIDRSNCGRMLSLSRASNIDVGLLLSHCADWNGATYCTLGVEIGSGNVNRGFYQCKAGTFQWLQFWDDTCERHACPQCFACPIYGCSSATFAGMVSSCNTECWSTVYTGNTYNTGYYLIAQFNTATASSANHDITIGGKVDAYVGTIACKTWRFKAFMRGNKCNVSCSSVYVDSDEAAGWLCFTRSVDTATCAFTLRVYAHISGCWSRYNTTIDYLAGGDVGPRYGLNSGCLTFPNTYAADATAFVGTLIRPKCSCGQLTADGYKTNSLNICCSFPANSKSYVLLGCFKPANNTCANNLELGFTVGGGSLASKGSIKALLTSASCCLNYFCNNNIEVKYSNYVNSLYGVSSIGFTTSGNTWNCCIGVWLEICNPSSSACCWNVSLLRSQISSEWSTCMTCQSTMPTFVCAIQIPACRRNFYYNNADAMINTWAYDGRYDSGSCKCMVFTFKVCGVGELRTPTHQKIFLSTTGTGVSTPLNMWIEYMKGTCKDYIAACYAGGDSEVIVPMRISSDHDNSIYIDYAVCCDVARQFCTHIYDSGNMPAGAQGNSAIINDLCGCWLYDAAGEYNLERNTQVVFNVDCPAAQFVTNVITAQTIAACCVATTSDIRQKKDIKPYNNGLSLVKNLDIISFRYLGENQNDIEHISIPANWSCQLISGKGQNQLRVNDAVGILLSAVKDLGHSMTLWQRIRLWFYKRFVEVKTNKVLEKKVKNFTNK